MMLLFGIAPRNARVGIMLPSRRSEIRFVCTLQTNDAGDLRAFLLWNLRTAPLDLIGDCSDIGASREHWPNVCFAFESFIPWQRAFGLHRPGLCSECLMGTYAV